jgi:hypothetical protein
MSPTRLLPLLLAAAALAACSDRQPASDASRPADATTRAGNESAGDDTDTKSPPATPPPESPKPGTPKPETPKTEADYLGRWTGVEGMYLVVASRPGGGVSLEMQWDLDRKGTFDGSVTAEGLRFVREGVAETAVHSNGDATGLKYLAGKQDCLTVKPGEGYCRD